MCGVARVSALVAAIGRGRGQDGMRIASWNPRWMVSPHTEQGAAKKKRIQRAIGAGTVVTIQETHWSVGDMAIWSGLFAGAEVVAAEARLGPNGGPQGGVAIVIPVRYEVLGRRTVVPGLCVEATIRRRGDAARMAWVIQSLYLPPDDRRAAAMAYVDSMKWIA